MSDSKKYNALGIAPYDYMQLMQTFDIPNTSLSVSLRDEPLNDEFSEDMFVVTSDSQILGKYHHLETAKWCSEYVSGVPAINGYVCSKCDMWNNHRSAFCPNCGAVMRDE